MNHYHSILSLKELWNSLYQNNTPFEDYEFLKALEVSDSIGKDKGWLPVYITDNKSYIFYAFIKTHSYGEYIFDWQWADAYKNHGLDYYPKITSMIPLSPVSCNHFIGDISDKQFADIEKYIEQSFPFLSSHHLLFTNKSINSKLPKSYLKRKSIQYHFHNNYHSFTHYLESMNSKKAKQVKKEASHKKLRFNPSLENN